MSGSPKPPKPTDPNVAAEAQARWSRYDTRGPGGSVTWQGSGPDAAQVTEWSPELQQLFGSASNIANQQRQQYQAPEGFASFRDRLMGQMNERQSQGRPVYQPTQRFEGRFGGGGSGSGGSAGGGPGEGGLFDGSGGPTGQAGPVSAEVAMLPFGGPGGMQKPGGTDRVMGKPMIPGMSGPQPDPTTQPVTDPGDKSLRGGIANMLGGKPTDTPWRDALLGPVGPDGRRHPVQNAMRGGLVGAVGRGIGNSLANAEQRAGKPSIDRQLGQIAAQVGAKPKPINNPGPGPQISPADPVPALPGGKPRGGRRRGLARSTMGRTGASLGYGNQIWGANQDNRALAAMGLHDYTGMEQ